MNPGTESEKRIHWLDGLRGVAILLVVLVHASQIVGLSSTNVLLTNIGQYGVQLFFLVSGFTISMTFSSHVRHFGFSRRSVLAWFTKRFFRIAPLYYLAICYYYWEHVFINRHGGSADVPSITDIASNFLFIHTWVASAVNSVVPGGWSIGVEMMFYALFPLLWKFLISRGKISTTIVVSILSLAFSELCCNVFLGSFYIQNDSYLYYWFFTQIPAILLGCLVFELIASKVVLTPHVRAWAILLMLLCAVVGLAAGVVGQLSPGLAPFILSISFVVFAILLHTSKRTVVSSRFFTAIGTASYSIYIVHFAVLAVAKLYASHHPLHGLPSLIGVYVLVCAISYGVALLTRRLIEIPGINLGKVLSDRISGLKLGKQAS